MRGEKDPQRTIRERDASIQGRHATKVPSSIIIIMEYTETENNIKGKLGQGNSEQGTIPTSMGVYENAMHRSRQTWL